MEVCCASLVSSLRSDLGCDENKWGRKHYLGPNSVESSKKCSSAFADSGSTTLSFAGKIAGLIMSPPKMGTM